jgi:hypothetical protein
LTVEVLNSAEGEVYVMERGLIKYWDEQNRES